eukprot:364921-Chlamydomonas_euryale.AAC.3
MPAPRTPVPVVLVRRSSMTVQARRYRLSCRRASPNSSASSARWKRAAAAAAGAAATGRSMASWRRRRRCGSWAHDCRCGRTGRAGQGRCGRTGRAGQGREGSCRGHWCSVAAVAWQALLEISQWATVNSQPVSRNAKPLGGGERVDMLVAAPATCVGEESGAPSQLLSQEQLADTAATAPPRRPPPPLSHTSAFLLARRACNDIGVFESMHVSVQDSGLCFASPLCVHSWADFLKE